MKNKIIISLILFFAYAQIGFAATPVNVNSITEEGGFIVIDIVPPASYDDSFTYKGVMPMKSPYHGGDIEDIFDNDVSTELKCKGGLSSAPYFNLMSSSTRFGLLASPEFHNGLYLGPWNTDSGIADCTSPSVYYGQFNIDGSNDSYYFSYYWDGTNYQTTSNEIPVPDYVSQFGYNTKLISVDFTDFETNEWTNEGSTLPITYTLDLSEFTANNRPDAIQMNLYSNVDNNQGYITKRLISPLTNGTTTINFNKCPSNGICENPVPDGEYWIDFQFFNINLNNVTFKSTYLKYLVDFEAGLITNVQNIIVAETEPEFGTIEYRDCGLTDISGCIINAGIYLTVPDQTVIKKFKDIPNTLNNKFPFVYVNQFSNALDTLYSGTGASSSISYEFGELGTMTLISVEQLEAVPYQPWLRAILGYLMWIMFAVLIYNRSLKIFNTNPQ